MVKISPLSSFSSFLMASPDLDPLNHPKPLDLRAPVLQTVALYLLLSFSAPPCLVAVLTSPATTCCNKELTSPAYDAPSLEQAPSLSWFEVVTTQICAIPVYMPALKPYFPESFTVNQEAKPPVLRATSLLWALRFKYFLHNLQSFALRDMKRMVL